MRMPSLKGLNPWQDVRTKKEPEEGEEGEQSPQGGGGNAPPDPGGYLEDDIFGRATWHSYSGQDLHGQEAVDKFLQYSDGSSNDELASYGYDTSGGGAQQGFQRPSGGGLGGWGR